MSYTSVRTRLAITQLLLTGVRISELRALTLKDTQDLFNKQRPHIKIDRLKGGETQKTAYISEAGAILVKQITQDFKQLSQNYRFSI